MCSQKVDLKCCCQWVVKLKSKEKKKNASFWDLNPLEILANEAKDKKPKNKPKPMRWTVPKHGRIITKKTNKRLKIVFLVK